MSEAFEPRMARELPHPAQPQLVARVLEPDHENPLAWWQDDFYEHVGTHWARMERGRISTWLRLATERAYYVVPSKKKDEDDEKRPWAPNTAKINEVANALGEAVVPRFGEPDECMALENCVLDVATRTEKEHHVSRFNLTSLPFRYDPAATAPQWLAFLDQVLPGDAQAQQFLQEWFGYVLSGRKNLHKMAALVGPRRCGKGTIAGVLQAMVGVEGYAAPILSQLGERFGTENMIGKQLAVMGDVRWSARETQAAIPILLALGSEDSQDVQRKNRATWTGKLGVRVVMMSNDLPSFKDTSGALAGRLVLVEFKQSFYGREDTGLGPRLLTELSGILNWALDGLDRLTARGHFLEPDSAVEARSEMDRETSPILGWVDSWCDLTPGNEVSIGALFEDYRSWCQRNNITHEGTVSRFSRDIRSAFGAQGVTTYRTRVGGEKTTMVVGIAPRMGRTIEGPAETSESDQEAFYDVP